MNRKNLRRVSVMLNTQTLYHLERMAAISGYGKNIGKVIDKLVREKQLALHTVPTGDDTCLICGAYVPEGRMVCPSCEKGGRT